MGEIGPRTREKFEEEDIKFGYDGATQYSQARIKRKVSVQGYT